MRSESAKINNEKGLHARPATSFLKACLQYQSKITIAYGEQIVNAKSMTSLLKLGIPGGTEVILTADGIDEFDAIVGLKHFLQETLED